MHKIPSSTYYYYCYYFILLYFYEIQFQYALNLSGITSNFRFTDMCIIC
jgi:hypothetical protein